MQNVYDLAHELARSLKETDQFKDWKRVKDKVDADERLSKMIADFSQQNMQFQSAAMMGQKPDEELMQKVQSMYSIIMQDPTCAEYLNAEMAFSQVVADIYQILGDAVNAK